MYTPVVGSKDKEWRLIMPGNQNAIKILDPKIESGVLSQPCIKTPFSKHEGIPPT